MSTENRSSNTELSKTVTEALVAMVSAVTRTSPPAGEPLPGFIQRPIDRAVERIGRLLTQPPAQYQGEPVVLPACKAKLSMSHDWDQGYSEGWSACLDEIAKLGPLYARAALERQP